MPDGPRRLALLGVLTALVVAGGVLGARRRRASASSSAPLESSPARPQTFTCTCGREYRTAGAGRHRVVWPADAPEDEPVLGDACPECGTPFPQPAAA